MDWYFTSEFCEYLSNGSHGSTWDPTRQYYSHLVERLIKGVCVCSWSMLNVCCVGWLLLVVAVVKVTLMEYFCDVIPCLVTYRVTCNLISQ